MAFTSSCVLKMEKPRFWITTSPGSATLLYIQDTLKGHTGRLAAGPALPLLIQAGLTSISGADNIVVALGHSNRVCEIDLWGTYRELEKVLAAMQVPFPQLTRLRLESHGETLPGIPDLFLGGSAPRLQHFESWGIPIQGLPK